MFQLARVLGMYRGVACAAALLVVLLMSAARSVALAQDVPDPGGRASLDVAQSPLVAEALPDYNTRPLTVEAWVRLDDKAPFNVIVSSQDKSSGGHWELYSFAQTGHLSVYLPGCVPAEIQSDADIVDGRWHHVAVVLEETRVTLYRDGERVLRRDVRRVEAHAEVPGPVYVGQAVHGGQVIGCTGEIGVVRLREGDRAPSQPLEPGLGVDEHTLALWRPATTQERESSPGVWAWDDSEHGNHARAADAPPPPPKPFVPGRQGTALNAAVLPLLVPGRDDYADPPLTIEAWVDLRSRSGHNIIVSNEDKSSGGHWELFSQAQSGRLAAYLPGYVPAVVLSQVDIVEGGWRYVAMTLSGDEVVLYADGEVVARQAVERNPAAAHIRGTLYLGQAIAGADRMGCDGLIDCIRISRGLRDIPADPPDDFAVDEHTAGLWRFPGSQGGARLTSILARDVSPAANHGFSTPGAEWTPPGGTGYEKEPWETETDTHWIDSRINLMDTGRFYSAAFDTPQVPGTGRTYKGIAVRLGDDQHASVLFDTLLLRPTLGWSDGYIEHSPIRFAILNPPVPAGEADYYNPSRIGWAPDGDYTDPRPNPYGPLPEGYPRYRGLYTHGERIVFAYTLGDARILESYWAQGNEHVTTYTRTIDFAALPIAQHIDVFATAGRDAETFDIGEYEGVLTRHDSHITAAIIVPAENAPRIRWAEHAEGDPPPAASIILPVNTPGLVKLVLWHGPEDRWDAARSTLANTDRPAPLAPLTEPGPERWPETITAAGERAPDDDAFVVDTLPVPFDNPYHALMFTSDLGFLPNGDIAVATVHGDVWIVSGIDDDLQHVTWKRFATGLYQPLGLEVVDGDIYVLGRDQITILKDRDHNGEADYYQNFTNALENPGDGHAYAMCLERDSQGNFYFMNSGNAATRHGGCIIRVSPDGHTMQRFAEGFRHPNGMGVGPDDVPTVGDNEGNWVPATPIDRIRQGKFYGYAPAYRGQGDAYEAWTKPLLWLPRTADNAAGSQDWVPDNTWGPLAGHMLHLTWGRTGMFLITRETISGIEQGSAIPFPLRFASGSMRSQFNPRDNALYVTGLDGWLTAALHDGMLQRVRYTGQPANTPLAVHAHANGIRITLSDPIAPDQHVTTDTFTVERWNYRWSPDYGSYHYSVQHPDQIGEDTVPVETIHISPDRREIFLAIQDMRPAMQMRITHSLRGANDVPINGPIYSTVHELGERREP